MALASNIHAEVIVSNGNSLQLTNGAALQVDSGSGLILDDNKAASTFVIGDGAAGEILRNYGSITYKGTSGSSNLPDYLNIPVLNNGSFTLLGTAYGLAGNSGDTLEVKGSDPLTGNVSWYQNASGAVTSLQGNVTLQADASYTQKAGILVNVAGTGNSSDWCYLTGGTPGNLLTININGGTVQCAFSGQANNLRAPAVLRH